MATKIEYASVDDLYLDPTNPRLGRKVASKTLKQDKILEVMQGWTLDEIATSFLESGFFPQEALIVVKEKLYGKEHLVVVEGNRRLATVKLLWAAKTGQLKIKKWSELLDSGNLPDDFFANLPYIQVESRAKVSAYLGFRHVTGIKEWKPAEKAEYIAKLIEEEGLTYDQVRRKIGSKAPTVRSHYIAYRVLTQMDQDEDIDVEEVEKKFSVLYLSLRSAGAQKYLGVNWSADPAEARNPIKPDYQKNLRNYSTWLFGKENKAPLFSDSRHVDDFGRILESEEAVKYLERTTVPVFEVALRKSGEGERNVIELISSASDNIQLALGDAHVYKKSDEMQRVVRRLGVDIFQLLNSFPAIKDEILAEERDGS